MSNRCDSLYGAPGRRLFAARWVWFVAGIALAIGAVVVWLLRPDPSVAAAERAIERRDFAEASAKLEEALQRRPRDTRLLFLAARTARRASHYEKADEHLSACQRLQGPTPPIALERALLRAQQGDQGVETYLLARVEQDDPDSLLIWEVLIQYYLDGYQLFKARDCLDRYLEQRPDDVHALMGRGHVWERLFFYAQAVADFRRALEIEPGNDLARARLAENLLHAGPPSEAAEHFEELRRRHPESPVAKLGLARAWRQQGHTAEAEELLDAILAEHPQDGSALAERGLLALDAKHLPRAEELLRKAVPLTPGDRTALHNLCQCLRLQGKDDELRGFQVRLDQLDADLKRLGQLAIEVQKTPHDPALRCEGGIIFLRTGEEPEGVRWLNMALREAPAYKPAHLALAEYYQRVGQPELAARHVGLAGETEK